MTLTALIDDMLLGAHTKGQALYRIELIIRLKLALGWYMGLPKCLIEPQQIAHFLGMLVSSKDAVFRVPEDKMAYILEQLESFKASATITRRQLASLAGMVLALSPAVPLAPIYGKIMYQLMTGQATWDALAENPQELRQHLDFLTRTLPLANGKRWKKPEVATVFTGDASEHQYGGFTPNGELDAPFVQPFTGAERSRMVAGTFSSTLREMLNLREMLICMAKHRPDLLQHKHVLYQSDNQGMVSDINKQGGTGEILQAVLQIHELACSLDCEIAAEWHPREDELQQHADYLSKLVDSTEYRLNDEVLQQAVRNHACFPRNALGDPARFTLDVFASRDSTKVPGRFYSRYFCEGTLGVNALRHPWAILDGLRQFCLIHGPFGLLPLIVKKLAEEQCNGVLIYPDWHHRGWRATIEAWKRSVRHTHDSGAGARK